jgi:uncharacterized protein YegP (UPF0339 family)
VTAVSYPCYWLKKHLSGGWYWIYCDRDGRTIARSSETFVHYDDCRSSVDVMKGSATDPVYYSQ